jgi:hypothetical protein
VDKQHRQVPAGFRLTQSNVNVFAFAFALLDEPELWLPGQHLFDFMGLNVVLEGEFVNNGSEPDDAFNVHANIIRYGHEDTQRPN